MMPLAPTCAAALCCLALLSAVASAGDIHDAAKRDDADGIRQALENAAEGAVDSKDADGNSALHWAAWLGKPKAAAALLQAGADVDATDGRPQNTALMKAAYNGASRGHDKVISLLLKAGASVGAQNGHGTTALMNAASQGNVKAARLLLEEGGADVHAHDQGGVTALHKAAWGGTDSHNSIIEELAERGADVNRPRADGVTPMMLATGKGATVALLESLGAEMPTMKKVDL